MKFDSDTHTYLVVCHISGGGAELGVGLYDFVDGLKEVFLGRDLPASSDGKHASLRAHAAYLRTWQQTHQSSIFREMLGRLSWGKYTPDLCFGRK